MPEHRDVWPYNFYPLVCRWSFGQSVRESLDHRISLSELYKSQGNSGLKGIVTRGSLKQ